MINSLRSPPADYNLLISPGRRNRAELAGSGEHGARSAIWGNAMNLPKIDISALPDLSQLTGMFGSLIHPLQVMSSDDTVVDIMVFVYEVTHQVPT
jgi:hypothetical protein